MIVHPARLSFVGLSIVLAIGCSRPVPEVPESGGLAAAGDQVRAGAAQQPLKIIYPLDGALFPPDIVAPTLRWQDEAPSDTWLVQFRFQGGDTLDFRTRQAEWTPPDDAWKTIKERSLEKGAEITVRGLSAQGIAVSEGRVSMRTAKDPVAAPLFFREVNLPFLTAVKNPAAYIRWRFGPISSPEPPPIVLQNLIVCGNCHSFSANGSTLAMEIDSGNDKGAYAIAEIEREIVLDEQKVITWSDYRREDGDATFGLLCQASPDGRYIVGTVKDRALAVYRPELEFSQLFFLVKGILAIYDRQTKTFQALPGADDPRLVQTNATWSPDGKWLVFARSEAYEPKGLEDVKSVLVPQEAAEDFLKGKRFFRYDLYRIPFNGGKGGKAEPVAGASGNGMSNYFAKFSPDGKWIVFCKANSFMLLQPDSELYIIPAAGGEARRLECNTSRMNSWHSWSPNGKWLVFSSKMFSPYTQLFLTRIDEAGHSSVPVILSRFTAPQRAANIPEFVNTDPGAIRKITEAFLDDHSYYRAGRAFFEQDDLAGAVPLFRKALEINPANVDAHYALGAILSTERKFDEAKAHFEKILALRPDHAEAHQGLAAILREEGKRDEAAEHFRRALESKPALAKAQMNLGLILLEKGKLDESAKHLAEAARLEPKDSFANYYCGHVLFRQGKPAEAVAYYQRALEYNPKAVPAMLELASIRMMREPAGLSNLDEALALAEKACTLTQRKDPVALNTLAGIYAMLGRFGDAASTASEALQVARATGDRSLAESIEKMLKLYEQFKAKTQK